MECGVVSVILLETGLLKIVKSCAVNWDSMMRVVSYYAVTSIFIILTYTEPLLLDYSLEWFGTNKKAVIGDVHCVGMEKELLECTHASIGSHYCGRLSDDEYSNGSHIVISCYGTKMCTVVVNCTFMRNI